MKTGGTTARLLVAATLFRCPATRAASSRMPAGLAIAGDLGVAERPLRPGRLAWLENRLWPIQVIRRLPFRVLVIQTDNGAEFQSRFHWHLESHDIRHVYIRPRTPHLNGKVDRSRRVDEQEFYQLLDKNGIADDIHLFNDKLREWEDYCNYHRPHGALDGQTPYERLMAKSTASLSTKS